VAAIDKLARAKGIIFDARGYVKAEMKNVLSYLVDETITSPIWHVPQVIYPDRKNIVYIDANWIVEPRKPKIEGTVVFLTQGSAVSASETFMGMVAHYKLGEIVGQPTAGTNGNVNSFTLPGGYMVFYTGMRVLKHDRSQHHLIGIQPTVPMKRTLKGVKEGRDEYLEKALEIIEKSG
jgi:C-terminal processing protease CtpA/Prc